MNIVGLKVHESETKIVEELKNFARILEVVEVILENRFIFRIN